MFAMRKLFLLIFLIISFQFLVGLFKQAYATDFLVEAERTYTIDSAESIEITETRTIHNNSKNRLITKDNNEVFQIIVIDENTDKLQPSFLSAQTFIDGKIIQNKQGGGDTNNIEVRVDITRSIVTMPTA